MVKVNGSLVTKLFHANAALQGVSNVADSVLRNQNKGRIAICVRIPLLHWLKCLKCTPFSKAPDIFTEANVVLHAKSVDLIYMKIVSDLYNATSDYAVTSLWQKWSKITLWTCNLPGCLKPLLAQVYICSIQDSITSHLLPTDGSDGVPAPDNEGYGRFSIGRLY